MNTLRHLRSRPSRMIAALGAVAAVVAGVSVSAAAPAQAAADQYIKYPAGISDRVFKVSAGIPCPQWVSATQYAAAGRPRVTEVKSMACDHVWRYRTHIEEIFLETPGGPGAQWVHLTPYQYSAIGSRAPQSYGLAFYRTPVNGRIYEVPECGVGNGAYWLNGAEYAEAGSPTPVDVNRVPNCV